MKFSLFSDIHYCPGVFRSGDEAHLEIIQKRAEKENVDFIIHAGDFTHGPGTDDVREYLKMYNDFHIPSYHCLGNHDTDRTSYEETLKLYNMPDGHYFFDCNGYRMIICDPNYYLLDGEYIHYSLGNYYKHGELRDHMPPEQLEWLRETIDTAEGPCILISHESFERERDGVKNLQAVRDIINEANKKKPHSVLMCINGHYHRDHMRIIDGVVYFEINSASYEWLPKAHDLFPQELCKKWSALSHTVCYNDPVHAIVTIEGTTITVDGMESSMFMGLNSVDTGNRYCDGMGRPVYPRVQSAKITLG